MNAKEFVAQVAANNPGENEFLQAVEEVVETIWDTYQAHPEYVEAKVLDRLVEPERIIMFRVPWVDDNGVVQVNKGYRVQFNSAIGPYKGGLRFHPAVNLSMLKFLGFEQIFKNSLTTLPMGGGKGGANFDPKGKSDAEIMRFCQAFMAELCRHIGADLDVPAGDVGVGGREIGFMFGMYKKIRNEFVGTLTGKGRTWGGSIKRPEATGFGATYYVAAMLNDNNTDFNGKRVAISGFGNVAWGAAQKITELGGKVVAMSGPDGYVIDEDGIGTPEKWNAMLEMRASNRNMVEDYLQYVPTAKFVAGAKPWEIKDLDIAMPCAFQNELNEDDAKALIANGVKFVAEVSNMGCTAEAVHALKAAKVPFGPGKAVNAGGVAVSGLEMTQNSERLGWTGEEVDTKLKQIMASIHENCVKYGMQEDGYIDYAKGANIAGFMKVAQAMLEQGIV